MKFFVPAPRGAATTRFGACLAAAIVSAASAEAFAQARSEDGSPGVGIYAAPAEGGVRRWRILPGAALRLLAGPAEDGAVVSTLSEAAILANLGCTRSAEQIWCEVRSIRGGARGFASADRLVPAQGPDGTTPMGVDDSKHRARRRDFDAKGDVRCAQERGQALRTCAAAVARSGGGDATVVATFPNGFARQLYFVHGEFVSASATMSGVGTDTDWRLVNGIHMIRVDDQRYELPESLVFGD